jgi:hypothetical protein
MKYGIEDGVMTEPAQVVFHLPENWTKILLLRTYGLGLADGGAYWDIPTELIPTPLRALGSRFVIVAQVQNLLPSEPHGRELHRKNLRVMELPKEDRDLWPDCRTHKKWL